MTEHFENNNRIMSKAEAKNAAALDNLNLAELS